MTHVATNTSHSTMPDSRVMETLNKNRNGDKPKSKTVKAMGLAACQGQCITYNVSSKVFCR